MERLAELAEYDRAISGLVDEDFLAAGFTPEEISSYRSQTSSQPISQADQSAIFNDYGAFQQPDYTLRERAVQGSQDILSNTFGMDPYNAGVLSRNVLGDPNSSRSNYGIGLADFTPLGAAFAIDEGGRTSVEGYQEGDYLKMGLGGVEAGLGVAEAFPLTRPIAEGASILAREIYSSPYMADAIGTLRGIRDMDADFLLGRGDPAMSQGVGADVTGRAPLTFDEVEAAMAEAPAAPVKQSAAEMRRQANIQRFGYDPNEVVERTPTDNAGFEAYLEQVNPGMKRIAEADRPNLMMGDMYGMMPKGSEVVGSKGDVTFHRSPDGEYYATAFNPDVNEEDVIGYITDRGDGTELAVVEELQGQGIGGELQYLFRKENPDAPTGGLTEAGEASLRKTYQRLADEGIVDGDVPFGGASAPEALLPAPRNEAEAMAKQVLEMRAAGNAGDVTEEMMAAADDQYMYFNTPLPMDEASRMARAREMGRQAEGLHGTVTGNDFSSFRGDRETYIAPVSQEGLDLVSQFSSADQGRVFPLIHTSDILDTADPSGMSQQRRNMQALYDKNNLGDFKPSDKGLPHWSDTQAINVARGAGYGGIKLEERDWVDSTAVFDPANIRSRFARFDPEFRNLKNLSAGVGGAAVLTALADDVEAGTPEQQISELVREAGFDGAAQILGVSPLDIEEAISIAVPQGQWDKLVVGQ